jgi:tetratricopeptide (TPR) repeat protein
MTKSLPLLLLLAGVAFAQPPAAPSRLAESIALAPQGGAEPEDREIARWQERARRANAKASEFEQLGWAYVAKARRTLDAGYYKLAEKTADAMEARFGSSGESQLLRGHVLHNLHRFREAEAIARELVAQRGSPNDLALLSDALMEQGKLAEAIAALQRLVELKPGVESYSRIAHLRWLKGDLPGAIAMMESAARATGPFDAEAQAWTLSRLAFFYLQSGQTAAALTAAEMALKQAPSFPPALLARGRALMDFGKTEDALGAFRRAVELNPLPEYQWWLVDALRATDRGAEATEIETQLRERGEVSDPRTLALFLATRHENIPLAERLAREELTNRADVFSHDSLAWALFAKGDLAAAEAEIRLALAEHTKDARLFLHAGAIARAADRREDARKFFAQAEPLAASLTPSERQQLNALARSVTVATAE